MKLLTRILLLCILVNNLAAQLSGSYSVPATYSTIATAISALNTQGVSGPVTINISAGYTETVPVNGFSLTATGTTTNPIIFQKSGSGANPLLTAYTGGTATPSSALQDGIWRLIGCDYITIDGIDLLDPNTVNPATMEFGYGLFKATAIDGCQNNTIKNCVVTLNRVNNGIGGGPAAEGSRGIDMVNALSNVHTTALTITLSLGANSNNKFYSNTILNCNYGMALSGYADSSPYSMADVNNDVGGGSVLNGNTIINFGGGGTTSTAAAIRTLAQYNINIAYNLINNNNGTGVNHATVLRGIYMTNATDASAVVTNNTLTLNSGGNNSLLYVIHYSSNTSVLSNTITINNNLITNCTYTGATTGPFRGIYTTGNVGILNVNSNNLLNNSTAATSGSYYNIYNDAGVGSTGNFNNNVIDMGTFSANSTNLDLGGIFSGNSGPSTSRTTGGIGGTCYMIYNGGSSNLLTINANNFNNLNFKHNGQLFLIYTTGNTANTNVSNNFITTGFTHTGTGGTLSGYFSNFNNGIISITGNNFSNITLNGTASFNGFYCNGSASQLQTTNNNTITNVSAGTGSLYGIRHFVGSSGSSINSNFITNFSCSSTIYGIQMSNVPALTSANSNTLSGFSSSGAANMYGIFLGTSGGSNLANIIKNKISDFSGSNASSTVCGIYVVGGTTVNLSNNIVGDLKMINANSVNPLRGIYLADGANIFMSHNTVYLSASSNGLNFGSCALYASTTSSLNLRNNILINNSTSNGTGKTVAYYRSSNTLTTYSSTSNNNIFYAGAIPSSSYCIYYDGTNTYSTISSYQNLVGLRDIFSHTENTAFTSTVGSNSAFLHISNSPPSVAESNGVAIIGINDDIDGQARFGNVGYTGTGVGVDIGADEYNGTFIDLLAPIITHTTLGTTCSTGNRTLTATITDNSGVPMTGSLVPTVYYKKNSGSYVFSSGVLASGTASNGVWNFTISSSALGGVAINDVISYFIIAQDTNTIPNVGSSPLSGLVATSVTSVTSYPTSPNIYTVTSLAGTYLVGAGGNYTTLSAAANAYNTSCLSGSVNFVLTDALYSSSETFPVILLNNAFANTTNSLYIYPASSVTTAITPTSTSIPSVFKFIDARHITLDGLNTGGSAMNISNSNSTSATAGVWIASSGSGCNTIAIKNLNLSGGSNTVIASYGIIAGTNSTSPVITGGTDNDNITIQGVNISKFFNGIVALGTATTISGGINNWTISNNQVGPVNSNSLTNLALYGMQFQNAQNLSITNNTVSNIISSAGYLYGIILGTGVTSTTLNANKITSVKYTGSSSFAGIGLDIQTGNTSSNLLIQNNMISDISGRGGTNFTNGGYSGVRVGSGGVTGGIKFYNNSIAMNHSNTISGGSSSNRTACMYFEAGSSNIELINNLLYSDITFTNSLSRTYALFSVPSSTAFSAMNYNNYYVSGAQGMLARWNNGTDVNTLSFLQTLFGNNTNSQNLAPVFNSLTDLHLALMNNFALDNLGVPVLGVNTDIDGQTRSLSAPDIGADEFTTPNCSTVAAVSIYTPTSYNICVGQNIVLTRSDDVFLPGIQKNWQISSTSGGPYTLIPPPPALPTPPQPYLPALIITQLSIPVQ
jgi:hypothetical protein